MDVTEKAQLFGHPKARCIWDMLTCTIIAWKYLLISVPVFHWEPYDQVAGRRRHLEWKLRNSQELVESHLHHFPR